ncbi:MAG: hypothetical protein ACPGXZ_01650 [Saprospiraceae bacterium]
MRISILLLLVSLTISVTAQSFKWGTPVKHEKLEFSENSVVKRYLLAEGMFGMKRLRVEKGEIIGNATITLEVYDINLELKKTKVVFEGGMDPRQYEDIIIVDNKFHVFTTFFDYKAKTNTLKLLTFGFDGEQIGEDKVLDVIENSKILGPGNFYVAGSKNGQHFASIGLPPYKRKTQETVQVKTYDADFNEVFSDAILLEHKRKRILSNTPFITNAGEFYMTKRIKVKKIGEVFEMYHLDKGSKKLSATAIDLPQNSKPATIYNTVLEANNGDVIWAGEQKEDKNMRAARGVFFVRFDKTGKVVDQMAANLAKTPKLGITGFSIKKVELIGDDLYYFADLNGRNVQSGSNPQQPSYAYSGGNLHIIKVSNGKIAWENTIERSGITQFGGKGSMVDWGWNIADGTVVVFYNDLHRLYDRRVDKFMKDAPNLIPIQVVIGEDGQMEKFPLLNADLGKYGDKYNQRKRLFGRVEDAYAFCPNEIYQRDGFLLVKCTNGVDFKLGKVKY